MPTVPATGQFGPPLFTVRSIKGTVVDAKWLTDNTGASYIIDPNTGRPYIPNLMGSCIAARITAELTNLARTKSPEIASDNSERISRKCFCKWRY